jgi:hypothetical protein
MCGFPEHGASETGEQAIEDVEAKPKRRSTGLEAAGEKVPAVLSAIWPGPGFLFPAALVKPHAGGQAS